MALIGTVSAPNDFGFKNRIINGAMVIDQRNVGASSSAASGYPVDRFAIAPQAGGYITWGQNLGSVTPPNGFANYLGFSTTTTYSLGAGDSFRCEHLIEGYNVADLGWGTANAQSITISFWTRSSLTGTHAATLQNSGRSRSYPFTWTINSANTWEYKTVTIAGDTTGTWLTTNGIGIRINFNLGCGATGSGTAGSWSSSNFVSATGAVSVVGTSSATLYITGVQLEKGTTATSFDYRSYTTELSLCKRYCHVFRGASDATFSNIGLGMCFDSTGFQCDVPLPVQMRVQPTVTYSAVGDLAVHLPGLVRVTATAVAMSSSQSGPQSAAIGITTTSNGNIVSHKCGHFEFNNSSTGWLALAAEM